MIHIIVIWIYRRYEGKKKVSSIDFSFPVGRGCKMLGLFCLFIYLFFVVV